MCPRRAPRLVASITFVLILLGTGFRPRVVAQSPSTPDHRADIRDEVANLVQMHEEIVARLQARVDAGRLGPDGLRAVECDLLRQRIRLAIMDRDVVTAIGHARRVVELRRAILVSAQAGGQRADQSQITQAKIDLSEASIDLHRLRGKTAETLLSEALAYRP